MQCDRFENAKVRKHLPAILANNPSDAFYPMCISEHGTVGPQGMILLDLLFARAACPAAAKTYWMRRLHVTTARRVHAIMHTQLRGYESPTAPAPQPAAEALSVQTDAANDDDGGEDDAPRVVLPLHPEGLPPDALGALRQQEVHEDDDSRHMWLQEAVADGVAMVMAMGAWRAVGRRRSLGTALCERVFQQWRLLLRLRLRLTPLLLRVRAGSLVACLAP